MNQQDDNTPESALPIDKTTTNPAPTQEVVVSTDDIPTESTPGSGNVAPISSAPVSEGVGRGHKKLLLLSGISLLLIGVAVGAYALISSPNKTDQKSAVVTKKDVPVLRVVVLQPLAHSYYPKMEADAMQYDTNMQLFEGLTKFANDTTLKPDLADSWTNPDSSTWVFKLHPNVKFHTGKTMTATDVKGSIDAIKSTDYGKSYASTIASVTVVDPLTVKITTDGPDPLLASKLANLFIYDTTSSKQNDAINGTGPYTLASDTQDVIKLAAFDGYHGGHVYTREVDYLGYQAFADIPAASLQNRQIQVIELDNGGGGSSDALTKLTGYGYKVDSLPAYAVGHLVFNTLRKGSPLAKVEVRKAVAQALDKNKILQLLRAQGSSVDPASQTIAKGIPGYNPAIQPVTYSQAAAKAALTAAGYPNGFSLTFTYFPSGKNQVIAPEVQKELAAVGITVKLDPESEQSNLISIAFGGKTDMFFIGSSSNLVDGSDIIGDNFIDSANYSNTELNKLNAQASQDLNPKTRVATLQQMAKLLEDDQADIPLYQSQASSLVHDPSLVIHRDTTVSSIGVYFWQTYAK